MEQGKLTDQSVSISNLIENASHIAVIPSKVYGANSFSAAVGLYYMLLDKEKEVYFVHTGKIPEPCVNLIPAGDITQTVSQRELLVSVNYANTPASKFHWFTENDTLNVLLSPIPKDFDQNARVSSKILGFDFDLIFTVGAQDIEDLGHIYKALEKDLHQAKVVNIDNTNKNQKYGVVNVIDANSNSLSELIFKQAPSWNLIPSQKAAKALLVGMTYREPKIAY